jgi:pimeloyl-ACP methyl ester carboxylesterase
VSWPTLGLAATASRVSIGTEDGLALSATVWEPAGRATAAVVMVHAPSRNRHDFDQLGEQLAGRGLIALSVDLRGHGDSQGAYSPPDLQPLARDVGAAVAYLLGRADSGVQSVGIVGASAGATLGVVAAGSLPSVRSFVLLSAPLDFRGLRLEEPLRRIADRAVLVVASREDVYAARCARTLAETGPGRRELMLLDGAGHGARMLTSRPDLLPGLVDWFARTLL